MNPNTPLTTVRQALGDNGSGLVRAGLYARVSTLNGQDPELQLRELREYSLRRGWQVIGEYVDTGISGAKDSRPELNRLMADAHKRKVDIVCEEYERENSAGKARQIQIRKRGLPGKFPLALGRLRAALCRAR